MDNVTRKLGDIDLVNAEAGLQVLAVCHAFIKGLRTREQHRPPLQHLFAPVKMYSGGQVINGEAMIDCGSTWTLISQLPMREHDPIGDGEIPSGRQTIDGTPLRVYDILFPSATSLALIGYLEFHPDQSFLNAVDPAMLTRLCFTMVHFHDLEGRLYGDRSQDRQRVTYGALPGLLSSLTGRCSALRSLTLRRRYQVDNNSAWWQKTPRTQNAHHSSLPFNPPWRISLLGEPPAGPKTKNLIPHLGPPTLVSAAESFPRSASHEPGRA
ncbi:hypothetical protein MMC07_004707 [Pseudocyphellaria aurata]|nr:hypothetical protein [Pseudocyphellaria aurata]